MTKKKKVDGKSLVGGFVSMIKDKTGGMTPKEAEEATYGVPIETYGEQYLRDSNVYLTGKTEMYVGGFGSGKTSYGLHVGSRFLDWGGMFFFVETENKMSPLSLKANIGPERFESDRVVFIPASRSTEAKKTKGTKTEAEELEHILSWQNTVKDIVTGIKKDVDLREVPVYVLVDSILGAPSAESRKEYDESGGFTGRSTAGMAQASSITDFLKNMTADLRDTNITVGFTNHGKTQVQMGGMPSFGDDRRFPGGASIGFHCSLVLWFERVGKISSADEFGRKVRLSVYKNSFGGEERDIRLDTVYRHAKDENGEVVHVNGAPLREVEWDWHGATGDLLSQFCSKSESSNKMSSAASRAALKLDKKAGKYICPALGLDKATSAELSRAFAENEEVRRKVLDVQKMGIGQYRTIDPYPVD